MAGALGQQVVVENRNTLIASELAAKAAPDGYTLLINSSSLWLAPFLRNDVPWDPQRDFAPVNLMARIPGVLVVHPSLRLQNVADLVALARARPGQLNYSNVSSGGPNLLATVLFASMAGINIVRVNYKGTTAALTGLLTGDTQMAFTNAGSSMPYIKTGKLTALAVTTAQRSPVIPGLPTIAASGLPGYQSEVLLGMFAPAATPPAIIALLHREIARALQKTEIKQRLSLIAVEALGAPPEQLDAAVKAEMVKWGKLIKEAGVRAD
jgi:tripartite-type tricarboxylate transporter receptor subunit TctC